MIFPPLLHQFWSVWDDGTHMYKSLVFGDEHGHVRIEKSPVQTVVIKLRFPRISLYAETLRFVLMEITKAVKPFIRRGANTFGNIVYMYVYIYIYIYIYI